MHKKQFDLNNSLSMNLFICIATYVLLTAYCVISFDGSNSIIQTGGSQEPTGSLYRLQFYLDSIIPSTLTLAVSIIIQNIVEFIAKNGTKWILTACSFVFVIVYTMICVRYRAISGYLHFIFLMLFTIFAVMLCFLAIIEIQKGLDTADLGIAAES